MTDKQTNFADLNRKVLFGESNGKIIWQPRIGCWFGDKQFAGEPLPAPFNCHPFGPRHEDGMRLSGIYRELNCSNRVYDYNRCFKRKEHPSVVYSEQRVSATRLEGVFKTPVGNQPVVYGLTANSPAAYHVKWQVTNEDEMKVAIWRVEHTQWEWDQAVFEEVAREWGDLGAPAMYMPRVTVQDLYINLMGVENGTYALYDWPDAVEAYFRALNECDDRLISLINDSPVDIINFGDNVHAGTLSPQLFKKYVLPAYQHRCERLHKAGKFVHAHWDGDTKPLLPFAHETGLDGIEAITPKPQGDVTLEEIKEGLGDDLFLLDGIPAVFFDATYPVSMLEDCARRLIELFAPRLVLGISDEISSHGDIERIRIVGKIVDEYNSQFG